MAVTELDFFILQTHRAKIQIYFPASFCFPFYFLFFYFFPFNFCFYFCSISIANFHSNSLTENNSRFEYGSFRLLSARLRLQSICLRPTCQFAYVLNLKSFILILSISARFNKDFSTIQF